MAVTQTYLTGEEVRLGDRVRRGDDEGKIVALEEGLPAYGLSVADSRGKAMIEFKKMGLMCEWTSDNEDLKFVCRASP